MWIDTGCPYTAIASMYCFYCDNLHFDTYNQTASSTYTNSTDTAYNSTFFVEDRTIVPRGIISLDGWMA